MKTQTRYSRLFPKVVGTYFFDMHKELEEKYVNICDEIKEKNNDTGGKNWISQSVYNTENIYNLNEDHRFKELTRFINESGIKYCEELKYAGFLKHTNTFFNIYNKYDYQDWHDHPGTHLSGVYCLSGEKGSADIHFTDFNNKLIINVKEFTTDNSSIWHEDFEPGKLLIFRSDLLHCVNRHELDTKRYSLATNFIVQ
jgi:uncharacterized protein (TIGR02466 family)